MLNEDKMSVMENWKKMVRSYYFESYLTSFANHFFLVSCSFKMAILKYRKMGLFDICGVI